jgi:hypothetical protein
MNLPFADQAVVSAEKVRDYLLSHSHPTGRHKARVFNTLGFGARNWRRLRYALKGVAKHGNVHELPESTHGRKFSVYGMLQGPNGRSMLIVSIWILRRGQHFPRLVTASPKEE